MANETNHGLASHMAPFHIEIDVDCFDLNQNLVIHLYRDLEDYINQIFPGVTSLTISMRADQIIPPDTRKADLLDLARKERKKRQRTK